MAGFGLLLWTGCSSPSTLRTHSLSASPSIDGALSEWGGALTRVGDRSVSMSVAPTDSLLYVAFVISDQELIRSVAENGLVLWVDPSGSQQHTYGVRYPLGLRAQRAERTTDDPASNESPGTSALDQLFPSDLAIIRTDTVRHRMPVGLSSALHVQATLDTGSLIYEIAIPVRASASQSSDDEWQHGLHSALSGTLNIGLETPDPEDDSELFDQSRGVPSVTGGGRRGRSPQGRQRTQRRSPASQSPDRPVLDLWTKVVLSEEQ